MTGTTLTVRDKKKLARCEEKIVGGMRAFYEVGEALETIRDEDLYLHHAVTFAEYCITRWEMTPQRASQLIGSAQAYRHLLHLRNGNSCFQLPENEGQTRPLLKLSKKGAAGRGHQRVVDLDRVQGVWQEVVNKAPTDDDGKPRITAKHVQEVVARNASNGSGQEAEEPASQSEEDTQENEKVVIEGDVADHDGDHHHDGEVGEDHHAEDHAENDRVDGDLHVDAGDDADDREVPPVMAIKLAHLPDDDDDVDRVAADVEEDHGDDGHDHRDAGVDDEHVGEDDGADDHHQDDDEPSVENGELAADGRLTAYGVRCRFQRERNDDAPGNAYGYDVWPPMYLIPEELRAELDRIPEEPGGYPKRWEAFWDYVGSCDKSHDSTAVSLLPTPEALQEFIAEREAGIKAFQYSKRSDDARADVEVPLEALTLFNKLMIDLNEARRWLGEQVGSIDLPSGHPLEVRWAAFTHAQDDLQSWVAEEIVRQDQCEDGGVTAPEGDDG